MNRSDLSESHHDLTSAEIDAYIRRARRLRSAEAHRMIGALVQRVRAAFATGREPMTSYPFLGTESKAH